MSDAHERLRRLLFLVPYVAKHPGVPVDELARALALTREELLEDLDLLTMVGRPPFQPDDYVDIYVDNDRVYVDLDQRLSAPPRLTASEAAALAAAAAMLRPPGDSPLAQALAKLEKVLPAGARDRFHEMHRQIDSAAFAPDELEPLSRALLQRREVAFDYTAQAREASERRTVRPLELFSHHGQWYLSAWCLSRNGERLFRLDRIRNLVVTDATFDPIKGRASRVPNPADRGEVRVKFSKVAAPYLRERFGDAARPLPDGGLEVRVAGDSEKWLTQWVLSFGGEAEVVEPAWARRAVANAARASLSS